MLNIITSLSQQNRREYLTSNLSALADAGKPACLIVPEQFLFETERNMYKILTAGKIAKINLTSFTKLAEEIVKKYGEPKLYADDIVKTVTMYKTVNYLKSGFRYYGSPSAKLSPAFAERMINIIAGLKRAGLSAKAFRELIISADMDKTLNKKTTDIAEIYSAYDDMLTAGFADKLDDIRRAAAYAERFDFFTDAEIFVDGFDGFSGSQILLLKTAMLSAVNLNLLLHTDCVQSRKQELFYINAPISRFISEAEREMCGVNFTELGGGSNQPEIQLWEAEDVYAESEFVAAKIRELVTECGYSYNDIAVLIRERTAETALTAALNDYEISVFGDLPEPIINKPMIRFILSAAEAVALETDKLLIFLRSGFVRVAGELELNAAGKRYCLAEAEKYRRYVYAKAGGFTRRLSKRSMDLLERAARRYRITARDWNRIFPESNADLSAIEGLRRDIIGKLAQLRKDTENVTGDVITEKICEFLIDGMELQRTVRALCVKTTGFRKGIAADKAKTEEYRKLWDLVIEIFESLHAALKDYPITLSEYIALLRGFFASTNIAKPPQVLDMVTLGDPERTRLSEVKAVFITGANRGVFPKSAADDGEFTAGELEVLCGCGIDIADNREGRYNYERYIVYKACTLPTELLVITAPLRNAAWEEAQLSPLFGELNAELKKTSDLPLGFFASSKKSARALLARNLGNLPEKAILEKALSEAGDADFVNVLINGAGGVYKHRVSPVTAGKLLRLGSLSPTALETMAECRFKFFCRYGLGISLYDREDGGGLTSLERGTLIHRCLESVIRAYKDNFDEFLKLPEKSLAASAWQCIDNYRAALLPDGFADAKRREYVLNSLKPGVARILSHIRDEFKNSKFRPESFEEEVSVSLGGIEFKGIADRTDRYIGGKGETYIRVVDYKSGSKELDLSAAFYGKDSQLLLYLSALSEKSGFIPASAFYQPVDGNKKGAVLMPDEISQEKKRLSWLESHKPSGFTISSSSEEDVKSRQERYQAETQTRRAFIKSYSLTPSAFGRLKTHCLKLAGAKIKRLNGGDVAAVPLLSAACDYCEYASACGNRGEREVKEINKAAVKGIIGGE